MRPTFITQEHIIRWNELMQQDPLFPPALFKSSIILEVCYAGLYLQEELHKLQCPEELITRIQWHGGKLSFGRDPWEIHLQLLNDYKDNQLTFEDDPDLPLN